MPAKEIDPAAKKLLTDTYNTRLESHSTADVVAHLRACIDTGWEVYSRNPETGELVFRRISEARAKRLRSRLSPGSQMGRRVMHKSITDAKKPTRPGGPRHGKR